VCWKEGSGTKEKLESELQYQLTSWQDVILPTEVPGYITTLEARELPVTSTGKIQRSVLKHVLPSHSFLPVNMLAQNEQFLFVRLAVTDKQYMRQAFALYNRCWKPLTLDEKTFKEHVKNGFVIIALDRNNVVQGMLSALRTSLSEKMLASATYEDITTGSTMRRSEHDGENIVCVSICSSNFQQNERAQILKESISLSSMRAYLRNPGDPVLRFHQKPKGGLKRGAKLVRIIQSSRPEDVSALGYNLLLRYPKVPKRHKAIVPNAESSIGVQLIEAVLGFAQRVGTKGVYAYSRPGGASSYFAAKKKRGRVT